MQEILVGGSPHSQVIMDAALANRHGLISGATGTGKTVTLQILAEGFSRIGVPVFLADIKGDLSGIALPGEKNEKIAERLREIGLDDFQPRGYPAVFWDLFGRSGHPVRTTVSDMGPLLLGNLLELNDTQSGVLYSCFKIADDNGLLLLDLKDLRSMLTWMGENARELQAEYGTIAGASLGAIQRQLLVLEQQGADRFYGEPALKLEDLCRTDFSGNGIVSILDAAELTSKSPRLYAAFLLWLLSELFENLPEIGDADRPKLVLFFDEAHLLFDQAPKALLDKIEQIVRLIRSKGVGVYFISQSPLDIPEDILGQLGLKIQHALRAFTPKDLAVVKSVAGTFRANPGINTEAAIQELKKGEALVSVLNKDGSPMPVQRILIRPPESRLGPMTDAQRQELIARSPYKGQYEQTVDRESAYELLKQKANRAEQHDIEEIEAKIAGQKSSAAGRSRARETPTEALLKSAARSIGSQLGRQLVRGVLGSLLGGRR
ncbi:helicase HerA-like domain-containing protein [Methylosarcina fibrata]|uniref:helicase HerA-like domain-containing protein n=1 Tax=Methylosarcina fibrata TaxID=105972 RepID=UPI0003AAF5FA|nr:helicase HerA-like domain-containing protein [Methylosarcina fibrata]